MLNKVLILLIGFWFCGIFSVYGQKKCATDLQCLQLGIQYFESAFAEDPHSPNANDLELAYSYCSDAISLNSRNAAALYYRGKIGQHLLSSVNHPVDRKNGADVNHEHFLAAVHSTLNDLDSAIALDPKLYEAYKIKIDMMFQYFRDFEGIVEVLDTAIGYMPDSSDLLVTRAEFIKKGYFYYKKFLGSGAEAGDTLRWLFFKKRYHYNE